MQCATVFSDDTIQSSLNILSISYNEQSCSMISCLCSVFHPEQTLYSFGTLSLLQFSFHGGSSLISNVNSTTAALTPLSR